MFIDVKANDDFKTKVWSVTQNALNPVVSSSKIQLFSYMSNDPIVRMAVKSFTRELRIVIPL